MSTAEQKRTSRVLVRTLPLRRGNYGGILQAFALQQSLANLGFEAVVDTSERAGRSARVKAALLRILSRASRRPFGYLERERLANSEIANFVHFHIATVRLFPLSRRRLTTLANNFGAVVVGSDQVWRPDYGDIGSYLLDFLPASSGLKRVAYAASFGVAEPNLARHDWKSLAERFDKISVRETSGSQAVAKEWGVDAAVMPDPTILLGQEKYESLTNPTFLARGRMVSYVLDDSASKNNLIERLGESLGLPLTAIKNGLVARGLWSGRPVPQKPGISEWITAVSSCDVLVTDSFHGAVFAILFNRPFVCVANPERGLARFETLFSRYGLEDRLVDAGPDRPAEDVLSASISILAKEIDWERINELLRQDRELGLRFLATALRE